MKVLNILMIIAINLFVIAIYVAINFFVIKQFYKIFRRRVLNLNKKIFYILFWILALAYIISSIGKLYFPEVITSIFTTIGIFWLAILYYAILIIPLVLLIKFLLKKNLSEGKIKNCLRIFYAKGIVVIIMICIILFYGVYNAHNPVVTKYDLTIPKKCNVQALNVVMVSDVHMGTGIKNKNLDEMVNDINKLKPDIVFLCGDMFDENTNSSYIKYLPKDIKKIHSKYGTYAVLGNHEYALHNINDIKKYYEKGNAKLLIDDSVKIANSFYVIGKDDIAGSEIHKNDKSLKDLTQKLDKKLPVIFLKHRPIELKNAKNCNIDLQFSGHTHRGQFFPNELLTDLQYKDSYGYLKNNKFQLIVTSGYGTWGPPIRIGTKSEIVNVKVKFK